MKPQQEKPARFDDYAGNYAELIKDPIREKFAADNHFFFERKLQVIRRYFHKAGVVTETLDWLDIGCGRGDMLRAGLPFFRSATGCDPSNGMLQACTDLQVRIQESPGKLPFDDAVFDFLTAVCVYHHVPVQDRPGLTTEALRVLKPGGKFCVVEHNPWNIATRVIVSRTPVDAEANLLKPAETRSLLSDAGTRVLATRFFLLFPEMIYPYFRYVEEGLANVPLGGQYAVFAEKPGRPPAYTIP
jgi:ubiquinone/menaquinone biosynthesis C-methylase UbiE